MSLLLHGPTADLRKLSQYIRNYQHLLERKDSPTSLNVEEESSERKVSWRIENKYYHADLTFHLMNFDEADEFREEFEGIILLPQHSKSNLGDAIYSIAHDAADRDLGLRLLVSFTTSDISAGTANHEHLLWAVDHGFEYIEINETTLLESHNERDKIGLPRLVEALQSVMWSTAQKKTIPKLKSAVDAAVKPTTVLPPQPATGSSMNDESFFSKVTRDSTYDDDDEEDMQFFEIFASSLAEARSVREKALSGQLSDQERRAQAAEVARKFSELFRLDEEEGDEEDNEETPV